MKLKLVFIPILVMFAIFGINAQTMENTPKSNDVESKNQKLDVKDETTKNKNEITFEKGAVVSDSLEINKQPEAKPKTVKDIYLNNINKSSTKKPLMLRSKRELELPKEKK